MVFRNRPGANAAMLNEVERLHKDGRPVLIGTTNVAMSDQTAKDLEERGIPCQVNIAGLVGGGGTKTTSAVSESGTLLQLPSIPPSTPTKIGEYCVEFNRCLLRCRLSPNLNSEGVSSHRIVDSFS